MCFKRRHSRYCGRCEKWMRFAHRGNSTFFLFCTNYIHIFVYVICTIYMAWDAKKRRKKGLAGRVAALCVYLFSWMGKRAYSSSSHKPSEWARATLERVWVRREVRWGKLRVYMRDAIIYTRIYIWEMRRWDMKTHTHTTQNDGARMEILLWSFLGSSTHTHTINKHPHTPTGGFKGGVGRRFI